MQTCPGGKNVSRETFFPEKNSGIKCNFSCAEKPALIYAGISASVISTFLRIFMLWN